MKRFIITLLCVCIFLSCTPAMAMQKNVASQKWTVFAFNTTTNAPYTSGAATITGTIYVDGTPNEIDDTNPTELGSGYYQFDIAQAETNGNNLTIVSTSSTSNIVVIGKPAVYNTVPPAFNTLGIANNLANVNLVQVSGDPNAADTLELAFDGTKISVTDIFSDAVAAAAVDTVLSENTDIIAIKALADKLDTTLQSDGESGYEFTATAMGNVSATVEGEVTVSAESIAAIQSGLQGHLSTTISAVFTSRSFTLTAGLAVVNAYKNNVIRVTDTTTGLSALGLITSYTAGRTATLQSPLPFIPDVGDEVALIGYLLPPGSSF